MSNSARSQLQGMEFLRGGGEMGARIRAFDWSATSLGPPGSWPGSLKTAVRIMLTSRQPMFVWWGPELINLYNDAYRAVLCGKHPEALGRPAAEVWHEIWDQVAPRAQSALHQDEGTFDESLLLIMERNGYPEETYYTFSYSPIPRDDGSTGGIICANADDTHLMINERQLKLLRELAVQTADARTVRQACALCSECLETNPYDLPCALIYLSDPEQQALILAGRAGLAVGLAAVPQTIALADPAAQPFREVLRSQQLAPVPGWSKLLAATAGGVWNRPPHQVVAVPIAPSGQTGRVGILLAGLNPFRRLDDDYCRFLALVSSQISGSIANAQAYEQERARAEKLAELDRAKTAFFSNVSHEFRTPLTLMLGPLDDLLQDDHRQLDEDVRQRISIAARNGRRLLRLVNTLLDFSRIEAGRVQARFERTNLPQFTIELASMFRSAIEAAGLRLVIDCPPLEEETYVDCDMWEKIVLNLLSNAFKYTFQGEIAVTLRVEDGFARLSVRDTGIGIPDGELPNLFNRFHRIESSHGRTHEGSGIGLAFAQELVRLHGGTIGVASRQGVGSTFTVKIPVGKQHLPPEQVVTSGSRSRSSSTSVFVEEALRWLPDDTAPLDNGHSASAAAVRLPESVQGEVADGVAQDGEAATCAAAVESQGNNSQGEDDHQGTVAGNAETGQVKPCIVLADDNADMRDYVRRLLSPQYEVIAVADGQQALDVCRRRTPDLVITDVMMPRLDGVGLLRALRADPQTKSVPVLMLSARAGAESRLEGLDAGADDYLVKPFQAREFIARVAAHIATSQLRSEALAKERLLRQQSETLNAVARDLAAELDLQRLLQKVTDAATSLTSAQVGAFFYNNVDDQGEVYRLYTRSGFPSESFERLPMPRNTPLFEATFRGEGVVRLADVQRDPRFGKRAPYYGFPPGHVPLRSYMAVPVVSRSGEVLGGLFFGHLEPNQFDEHAERIVQGIAAQAAVAIDNAQLYGQAQQEIARRAKVEAALRESEQRYRQLVQAIPAAIYTCDAEGRIQLYNDAAVELWGRRPHPGVPSWCAAHRVLQADGSPLPQDAWPAVRAARERCTLDGVEVLIERPDGSRRHALAHPQPLFDADGNMQGLVNMLIDITDRKQAYDALRQIEERFSRFMEHLPGLAWLKDLSGRYVFVNQAMERVIGKPSEEICGRSDDELFPRESAAMFRQNDQQVLRDGCGLETVEILERAEGPLWSIVSRFPIPGIDGNPALIGGIAIDITERVQAEQQLRESEARFRNLADHAPVPIWLNGLHGCEFVNREFQRLWGLTYQDAAGVCWEDLLHPDDRESYLAIYRDAFQRQVPFEAQCRIKIASGEFRWVRSCGSPRFTKSGMFLGFVGCAVDITDIKQSETALREADRRKDEFLAVLAHELRNPLAPIRTGLELLRRIGDDPGARDEVCATMERQTRQMVRLIDDLLDVSRITRGTLELRKHECELAAIVESAVEAVRPFIDEAGHQLHVELPPQRIILEADFSRLAQVLSNLLNNAAKYMPPGGNIWLSAHTCDHSVTITVRDTGIGIPPAMLESIFEMFTQVDRTLERAQSGLGIGLTLVKRLVEMHGGTVTVRSDGHDQGSEFSVHLPLPRSWSLASRAESLQDAQAVGSFRILVADDNLDAGKMLGMVLQSLGHDVRIVGDGLAAVSAAAEFRPEVVLLDIGMPRLNGYDTARQMRQQPWARDAMLIAVTGWGQQEDKRLSREAGFDHHLVKPVDVQSLQRLLADRQQ